MRPPSPRLSQYPLLFTFTCVLFTFTGLSASHSEDWGQLATISSTMGVQAGKLCLGEASRGDIGCPVYAPSVSPTGTFITTAISLTTGGTNWGYLGSNSSYLPNLATNAVSTTNISATTLNGIAISNFGGGTSSTMVPNWPDAIICSHSAGFRILYHDYTSANEHYYTSPMSDSQTATGYVHYAAFNGSGTYTAGINAGDCSSNTIPQLYAIGRAFNFLGGGGSSPTGAIMAFDLAACPAGWSEYTPARGRFLRGIDNGAGNDPSGTRVPGNIQNEAVGPHSHTFKLGQTNGSGYNGWSIQSTSSFINFGVDSNTGPETRPKNVAVLFCRKN